MSSRVKQDRPNCRCQSKDINGCFEKRHIERVNDEKQSSFSVFEQEREDFLSHSLSHILLQSVSLSGYDVLPAAGRKRKKKGTNLLSQKLNVLWDSIVSEGDTDSKENDSLLISFLAWNLSSQKSSSLQNMHVSWCFSYFLSFREKLLYSLGCLYVVWIWLCFQSNECSIQDDEKEWKKCRCFLVRSRKCLRNEMEAVYCCVLHIKCTS